MSNILRTSAIALFFSFALSACLDNRDGAQTQNVVSTATASEPAAAPREYYGRTEFEIPGGDGQVVDYQ